MKNLVFSNKFQYRIIRHVSFWVARLFLRSLYMTIFLQDVIAKMPETFWHTFLTILPFIFFIEMPLCYFVNYFLAPRFLSKGKYKVFAWGAAIAMVADCIWAMLYIHPEWTNLSKTEISSIISFARVFFFEAAPIPCLIFLALKQYKNMYQKELEKQALIKENARAENELLKAQVHPHFLFNTLNNIYSFALKQSTKAETLVQSLSDIINYMVNDCIEEQIELSKEIKVIKDYLELEKVRYGDRLTIMVDMEGDYENKMVTPLLMLPFVENAFKHGASKLLTKPLIKLYIKVDDEAMYFFLSNNKPLQQAAANSRSGIGLQNVQKRLSLLFPEKHSLKIQTTEDMFIVNMVVPVSLIQPNEAVQNPTNIISNTQTIFYARK